MQGISYALNGGDGCAEKSEEAVPVPRLSEADGRQFGKHCFMSWEQIAVDMGYEISWQYRLHDKALKNISFNKQASKRIENKYPFLILLDWKNEQEGVRGLKPAGALLLFGGDKRATKA